MPEISSSSYSCSTLVRPMKDRPEARNSSRLLVTIIRPSAHRPWRRERMSTTWYCRMGISFSQGATKSGTIYFPRS